jgi:hypothetical protein
VLEQGRRRGTAARVGASRAPSGGGRIVVTWGGADCRRGAYPEDAGAAITSHEPKKLARTDDVLQVARQALHHQCPLPHLPLCTTRTADVAGSAATLRVTLPSNVVCCGTYWEVPLAHAACMAPCWGLGRHAVACCAQARMCCLPWPCWVLPNSPHKSLLQLSIVDPLRNCC